MRTIEAHGHMVNAVTMSPDSRYILSASADMSCKLFLTQAREYFTPSSLICWFVLTSCRNETTSAQHSALIKVCGINLYNNFIYIFRLYILIVLVQGMAFCKATNTLVTGAWDNTAKIFDHEGYWKADLLGHAKRMYVQS